MTCIKMGSDESHFNVWGTKSQDRVHKPQLLKRKESRSGIKPRAFHLPAYRLTAWPNWLCFGLCFQCIFKVLGLVVIVFLLGGGGGACFPPLFIFVLFHFRLAFLFAWLVLFWGCGERRGVCVSLSMCVCFTLRGGLCVCLWDRDPFRDGWLFLFLSFLFCPLLTCACSKVNSVCIAIVVYY